MTIPDSARLRRLVRMYSQEVGTRLPTGSRAQDLGQLLHQEANGYDDVQSPWRKFFEAKGIASKENNPLTQMIAVEAANLRLKWLHFRQNCTDQDRLDLNMYEPSMESVLDVVEDIRKRWESERYRGFGGKIVKCFQKFCGTLNAHNSMLKILPESNEYISIFTGTLTTVIRASANHEKIAEGLSESLQSIGQSVAACHTDLDMFNTQLILGHVAELYGLIFLFLSAFMDWFMKKRRYRILDSFNEDLVQKYEKDIGMINKKAETIKRMVEQGSRAEVRETRLGVDYLKTEIAEMKKDVRIGLEGEERRRAQLVYNETMLVEELRRMRRKQEKSEQAVSQLTQTLREIAASTLWEMTEASIRQEEATSRRTSPWMNASIVSRTNGNPAAGEWAADDVAFSSSHLEDFFHRDRVRLLNDTTGDIKGSQEMIYRLADWTGNQSPESPFLWLDGPSISADGLDNPLTMVAVHLVNLTSASDVALTSHFCELRRGEKLRSGNPTIEVQGVIDLVCSLTRQMIELLPPVFETNKDLSEERFRLIDGSHASWATSIALFQDLIEQMPSRVFCVVDGLHWLDGSRSSALIQDLLLALRHNKLKVLFTTSGRSPTLREHLAISEVYVVERPETRRVLAGLHMPTFR